MTIQPEGFAIENANPLSVVNAENIDLAKLQMDFLGTSQFQTLIMQLNCDSKSNYVNF